MSFTAGDCARVLTASKGWEGAQLLKPTPEPRAFTRPGWKFVADLGDKNPAEAGLVGSRWFVGTRLVRHKGSLIAALTDELLISSRARVILGVCVDYKPALESSC